MPARSKLSRLQIAQLICLFLFVLGARWAVINQFGSDLPCWDQWDAEGLRLLVPWLGHGLTAGMLFEPHNEHRVVLTKLAALALAKADGQWDQRLECAVNALLPASIAFAFLAMAFRHLERKWHFAILLLLMAAFGLPLGWENILRGFASQQFFLIGLSFGAIALLPQAPPWSRAFFLGAMCAVLALGSMATGFFASAVAGALLLLRWRRGESSFPAVVPALIICAALLALGWFTRVGVPLHGPLKARNAGDFALALWHSLDWPGRGPAWSWMALVIWLPWSWLAGKALRGKGPLPGMGYTLAGLGAWVVLQLLATAYARGAGGPDPAPRYLDTLIIGLVVNALSIAWLWQNGGLGPMAREFTVVAGVVWTVMCGLNSAAYAVSVLHTILPSEKINNGYCEQNSRNYLATGDRAYLRHSEIPYPATAPYLDRLGNPELQSLLPASVRRPIPLRPGDSKTAFIKYDSRLPESVQNKLAGGLLKRPSGFSPATFPLTNRVTYGSFGAHPASDFEEWRSQPVAGRHGGWLKFEVAGEVGQPGVHLELRDAADDHLIAEVVPGRVPENSWRSAYVRAPRHAFVVRAGDGDPKHWLAFSEPVEMGSLSYWAWRSVKNGRIIAQAAGTLALLLALARRLRIGFKRRRGSAGAPWAWFDSEVFSQPDPNNGVLRPGLLFWALAFTGAAFPYLLLKRSSPPVLLVFFVVLAIGLFPRQKRAVSSLARLRAWARRRPYAAIFALSAVAVVVQCHPVLFFGRSFVSPNIPVHLLYDRFPTVAGSENTDLEFANESDVGALMWWHLDCPIIAHQALFRDGELPLWNRYTLCGLPSLGQGQAMFGDPLNWLPILTRSAPWSWDARFVVTRWLLCCGMGATLYALTGNLAGALLGALGAGFLGFFGFRLNHPANFSLGYSPWILFAWARLVQAESRRQAARSCLGLILANFLVMDSGTVKEAYVLIICLNLAGGLIWLLQPAPWRRRLGSFAALAGAGLTYVLLTAPWWRTFLGALKLSRTFYEIPSAIQVPASLAIGFFDDLFLRQLRPGEKVYMPAANFLFLAGLLWALAALRRISHRRVFAALGMASLVPAAMIFGLVPPQLIAATPFFGNIIHIENAFSCPLIILTGVLAGFGFAALFQPVPTSAWNRSYLIYLILFAILSACYWRATRTVAKSDFFVAYASSMSIAVAILPLGLRFATRRRDPALAAAVLAAGAMLLMWRHCQYLRTPFDYYVFNPPRRARLDLPSPSVTFVRSRMKEPSRPMGFGGNLFSGYSTVFGWESILGVDPLRNRHYDELAEALHLTRVYYADSPTLEGDFAAFRPAMDMLNIRYYLAAHQSGEHAIAGLKKLGQFDLDVYESPTAWPRAFFTDRVLDYDTVGELATEINRGDGRPFAAVQAKDATLPAGLRAIPHPLAGRAVQAADHYRLTTNTSWFEVRASSAGIIVLSENYYPGDFGVTVNGRAGEYFRVNHAFKGVYVDRPGLYRIEFKYWPRSFSSSLKLAGLGLAALAVFIWLALGKARPARHAIAA